VVATVNPGDGTPGSSSLAITTALTTIPVIVSLPTGSSPISVAATAGSSGLILVSLTGDTVDCPPLGGAVGIIQASNSVLNSVVCMPSANPGFILVLPGDQKALVLDKIAGSATFIINIPSVTSATVSTTLTVGASPVWAATSVDGHTAYVLNQGSSSISVIDAVGESVTTLSVPTGGTSPSVIVADHIQNRLYVSNTASNNVSVFDASVTPIALLTSANPNPVPLNAGAHPIALAVSGSNIYVANTGLNFANIINANTLAVSAQTIKPIPLASASLVTWVAVSQDGTKAYVSAYDPVGGYPIADGTVIGPDAANTTVILSTSTNAVITDIPSPPQNMDPNTDACLANPTFDNCKAVAKQRPLQIVPRI
jgi:YVTN family beta-propeller protein